MAKNVVGGVLQQRHRFLNVRGQNLSFFLLHAIEATVPGPSTAATDPSAAEKT